MKRIIFLTLFVAAVLMVTNRSEAQLSISVNIGNQPSWAPQGYDEAQSYYIPDMDMYYDVPAHQFVYLNNHRWVRTAELPPSYRNYDLYRVHKVAINQRDAYKYHDHDRQQYAKYRGKYDQRPIRDSRDDKYAHNRNNWDHYKFKGQAGNSRGYNQKKDHDQRKEDYQERDHRKAIID